MPNADGKTSLAKGNYKIDPNNGGFSNFSDDFAVGFTPLINEKFNELTEDSSQYTPSALSLGNDGLGVDFFDNAEGGHVGFIANQPQGVSMYIRDGGESIIWNGAGGYTTYENSVINDSAFNLPNAPRQPSENLNESVYNNDYIVTNEPSIYSNINAAGQEIETLFDEYLPGQVKEGQPNYDSYNSIPEPMLDKYMQGGSQYGLHGLKDTRPPEPSIPDFAQVAHEQNQAKNNAQGGGIESMIVSDPKGVTQMAVGMGIQATGGGEQDLQALAEPVDVNSTLDSALNNINSNYNNSFNGIL